MIVAEGDTVTPPDLAIAAFRRAREPKRLVTFKGSHYDVNRKFELCAAEAISWFRMHLNVNVIV
jgi:uncharacterized protein